MDSLNGEYTPLNFKKWIEENRHLLKPPVGNKMIWKDRDFIAMVVGGPNARTDFHYNEGGEFFHQLEGDITLKIVDKAGKVRDIPIREGEIYLLPPCTPHSPQRPANTVGLVIEKERRENEKDGLLWFCQKCGEKVYEEYFHLTNIETQFGAVFDRYYAGKNICGSCGHSNPKTWESTP